jgi:ligand-binding sensor domain-containing protein
VRATAAALAVAGLVVGGGGAREACAQGAPSRLWRADERLVLTDLSRVTAVAITQAYVFAATPDALAVYDRAFGALSEVLDRGDGFPGGPINAMVADPSDDTAWLAGNGGWAAYHPFGRRWEGGPLPGFADLVVLDAQDPSTGAYFHTGVGWFLVRKNGIGAEPVPAGPPPGQRLGPLSARELFAAAPGLEAVRLTIERDPQLNPTPITSAALSPTRGELYVGTAGNGVFRVDLGSYRADRLPAGLLGTATGAVAVDRDGVCAAADLRAASVQRGITCFAADLSRFQELRGGLLGLPGTQARRLLLTGAAAWLATDGGVLRVPRDGGPGRTYTAGAGLRSDDVRALAPAPDGVWIGTAVGVAVAEDPPGGRGVQFVAAVPPGVLALAVTDDTLWLGTPAGLLVVMPGSSTPLVVEPSLPWLREPVVGLAVNGDTILAALETRLAVRIGGAWRLVDPPGTPIGRFTAAASDRAGFWLGGTQGLAFYGPAHNVWRALTSTGDLPLPVNDVVADRDHAWVATSGGVVRILRRVLTR